MNKYFLPLLILLFLDTTNVSAKEMFRIYLKDKNGTKYNVDKPSNFLSERALERRTNQHLKINESDLPISEIYINRIKELDFEVIAKSKWLNTISISTSDSIDIEKLKKEPFIDNILWVGRSSDTLKVKNRKSLFKAKYPITKNTGYYGYASDQIHTVNGHKLHEKGYWGQGKEIAVIDAGFTKLNENLNLGNISIKGIKDFVNDGIDILNGSDHGISVLSAMATNQPNTFVGTAPKSNYWLLRSESSQYEYPIEEDYWVTAIEYADSVGVDIVNTSLGYYRFDDPARSYTKEDINGNVSFMTKAAEIAANKGILVVTSAGNEGNSSWKTLTVPADAQNVLTVGSMSKDSTISSFSSVGPTFDGRIKPDVVALGEKINLLDSRGEFIVTNGTSFSTPVMAGLAACLWEAFPDLTNKQVINIICSSSNQYNKPGATYGYGAPNMQLAMMLAQDITTGIEEEITQENESLFSFRSDSIGQIKIKRTNSTNDDQLYYIQIYNMSGRIMISEKLDGYEKTININNQTKQPYIIRISSKDFNESRKLIF